MLAILGDDMVTSRQAIAHVLAETHHFEVLQADDAAHALALSQSHNPALILLGALMPGLDTFTAAAQMRRYCPMAKIAILTRHSQHALLVRTRQARLNGFILHQDGFEELDYAIRTVLKGGFYFPPSLSTLNCKRQRLCSLQQRFVAEACSAPILGSGQAFLTGRLAGCMSI